MAMPEIPVSCLVRMGLIKVNKNSPAEYRFWKWVDLDGPMHPVVGRCWQWVGAPKGPRYGTLTIQYKPMLVHRLSYSMNVGEIPIGMYVCHRCDNMRCVRPQHLFLGTPQDNERDKWSKGRGIARAGTECNQAKLTKEQVVAIRDRYRQGRVTHSQLAMEYHVSRTCITRLISGESYRVL